MQRKIKVVLLLLRWGALFTLKTMAHITTARAIAQHIKCAPPFFVVKIDPDLKNLSALCALA
jgi:hypothetical protein